MRKSHELDHLALATVMLKDGHIKRAAAALKSVDLKDESIDQVRYFTISGVIAMRLKDFSQALKAFEKVIALGQATPAIHITRARCAFALKACDTVEEALSAAGDDAWKDRELLVMRSECAWTEKNYEVAIDVLARGKTLFPEERQFVRKHIERLMELGLYQTASEVGEELLSGDNTSPDDILFLAEALAPRGCCKNGRFDARRRTARPPRRQSYQGSGGARLVGLWPPAHCSETIHEGISGRREVCARRS